MDRKKETIDQAKVAAAFTKLQINPEMIGPVKEAFAGLFTKIGIDLSPQEELALARQIFASDSGVVRAGESDPVPLGKNCETHPVSLISYDCKSCPPPTITSHVCTNCPPPPLPTITSNQCTGCFDVVHSTSQCTVHNN